MTVMAGIDRTRRVHLMPEVKRTICSVGGRREDKAKRYLKSEITVVGEFF